jgi:putative transposase
MPDYRRHRVAGGCYFFTVNLLERRNNTLLAQQISLLRHAVKRVRKERPFAIDAWVVLPDHLHAVWTLPVGDDDFSTWWRLIKTFFARGLPSTERLSRVRREAGERGIWQRRFWEHAIRNDADYAAHVDYVHFNPVKHGLAVAPGAWPYSTFRRCVERGLYPEDWAGEDVLDILAGEPGE